MDTKFSFIQKAWLFAFLISIINLFNFVELWLFSKIPFLHISVESYTACAKYAIGMTSLIVPLVLLIAPPVVFMSRRKSLDVSEVIVQWKPFLSIFFSLITFVWILLLGKQIQGLSIPLEGAITIAAFILLTSFAFKKKAPSTPPTPTKVEVT